MTAAPFSARVAVYYTATTAVAGRSLISVGTETDAHRAGPRGFVDPAFFSCFLPDIVRGRKYFGLLTIFAGRVRLNETMDAIRPVPKLMSTDQKKGFSQAVRDLGQRLM